MENNIQIIRKWVERVSRVFLYDSKLNRSTELMLFRYRTVDRRAKHSKTCAAAVYDLWLQSISTPFSLPRAITRLRRALKYDLYRVQHNLVMDARLTSLLYDEIKTGALLVRSHLFYEFEFNPQWFFSPSDGDLVSPRVANTFVVVENSGESDDTNPRIWFSCPRCGSPYRQFIRTIEWNTDSIDSNALTICVVDAYFLLCSLPYYAFQTECSDVVLRKTTASFHVLESTAQLVHEKFIPARDTSWHLFIKFSYAFSAFFASQLNYCVEAALNGMALQRPKNN